MNEDLKKLKDLFENAKILEVKEGKRGSFNFFVVKDEQKYSFTLFDYEIGLKKDDKGNYINFQELLVEIFNHHANHNDFENDIFEAFDDITQKTMGFRCRKCGEEFKFGMKTLKDSEYYDLLSDVVKRKIFARILSVGWVSNKDIAIELIKRYTFSLDV